MPGTGSPPNTKAYAGAQAGDSDQRKKRRQNRCLKCYRNVNCKMLIAQRRTGEPCDEEAVEDCDFDIHQLASHEQ